VSPAQTTRQRWVEVLTLYSVMTIGTALLGWVGGSISWLSGLSGALVALGFIILPTEVLSRRGEKLGGFGIGGRADLASQVELGEQAESSWRRIHRSARQALWISAIVLLPYGVGTHFWRTFQGQEAYFGERSFQRWPDELRGLSTAPLRGGQVSLSASADRMRVRWRLTGGEREVTIKLILSEVESETTPSTHVSIVTSRSRGVQV
jgi:hypothetical protein